MKSKRVVIAGIGILSNLGQTFEEVQSTLRAGLTRVMLCEERKKRGFRSCIKTKLPEIEAKYVVKRKIAKYLAEASMYSVITWMKMVDECALNPEHFVGPDIGIIVGNDSSADALPEILDILEKYKETHFLGSGMVIKTMNSGCSMNLGPLLGAQGINVTLSAACASGAHAVGYAYTLIANGMQEAIVTGGFQETNWLSMASFDALEAFSMNEKIEEASRPFDARRDGLVPGGGGALLLLENIERAERLGHRIYGEIVGYGFSSDGSHITIPSGEGAERCMQAAMKNAGVSPMDIDYIHAHATSTPVGDLAEAQAIHNIFGSAGPYVSSTKSMSGHECWMAGASSVIYSLAMMQGGFLAPNRNFTAQEDSAPKINILPKTLEQKPNTILCNSFGFGGTNACLILKSVNQ